MIICTTEPPEVCVQGPELRTPGPREISDEIPSEGFLVRSSQIAWQDLRSKAYDPSGEQEFSISAEFGECSDESTSRETLIVYLSRSIFLPISSSNPPLANKMIYSIGKVNSLVTRRRDH